MNDYQGWIQRMKLVKFTQIYLPIIEEALRNQISRSVSALSPDLHKMLFYHMGWEGEGAGPEAQGKRIRPLLVLLMNEICGGDWKNAIPACVSIELLHNFSLIHDDIQDQSPLRHGRPTVWKIWGIAQAINAGDTLFAIAQQAMLSLSNFIAPGETLAACKRLNDTCVSLTEGQYLDLTYETRGTLTVDDYWPMITGKTAALTAACTFLGCLIAGAPPAIQAVGQDYGRNLGLAFQVIDDYLGIWGKAEFTGKSNESDLVTGKKTLPVLFGLAQNRAFAARWLQGKIAPDEVPSLAAMLESEGARQYVQNKADHFTGLALQRLNEIIKKPSEAADAARELTLNLLNRQT